MYHYHTLWYGILLCSPLYNNIINELCIFFLYLKLSTRCTYIIISALPVILIIVITELVHKYKRTVHTNMK